MKNSAAWFSMALVAATAAAQVRETSTVEVVEVPVYVTAHNAAVSSLTRDNFELYINGKRQPIEYFDVIDYATLSPEQHDVRQRRLYMLVFDLLSSANGLHRAQKAALQFVDASAATDTIGVATYSPAGLRIIVPFSHDHAVVSRAVRNLTFPALNDPLHLMLTSTERGESGGWNGRLRDPMMENGFLDPMVTAAALAEDEVASLTDLADRLAGMEGQRHVVLLSSGFDSMILTGVQSPRVPGDVRFGPGDSPDVVRNWRSPLPQMNSRLSGELEGLNLAYATAGVFLDAIDIAGLRPFQTGASNEWLYALVRDSGGKVIDRVNDLHGALQTLADTERVVYSLGFSAHDTGRSENRIAVKLVNVPRGTTASYRRSYELGGGQGDTGDMLRLADIIQNDIPQNGITANVTAEPAPNGAAVEVALPGRELLAHQGGGIVGARVMMYVMSGPSVIAFKIKRLDVELKRAEEALHEMPVRVRDTFDLPPGHYAAKVVVRMDTTGALGFGRADVTVPSTQ